MTAGCCARKQEERQVAYEGVCCHGCLIGDKDYEANEAEDEQNGYRACNSHIYATHAATNTTVERKQSHGCQNGRLPTRRLSQTAAHWEEGSR